MVRDGIYYALALFIVAAVIAWLTIPALAVIPILLAAFFLWFFRDPERQIPSVAGAVVSCADGLVTDLAPAMINGEQKVRMSIFLNVFNVHVNRSPVSGVVTHVEYRRGAFKNAMGSASAEANEQNICTVLTDDGQSVTFKQIAGLLARRIVFTKSVGDRVERGERVGLIKFGSRCDVILPSSAELRVKVGQKVSGGSTVLAILREPAIQGTRAEETTQGGVR